MLKDTTARILIAAFALALVGACSEKPPRADPERGASLNLQKGSNPTADRTLEQGEFQRLGN